MDYSLLTEKQTQKRFYSLPEKIRNVLNSENNIEIVRKICQTHYLSEEKTSIVEQLVGLILLGFVSPDEMSQEISENLHLDNKHSNDIAREIDRKIFAPIRADLEKIYAPPAEELGEIKPLKIEEEIVDLRAEVKKPEEAPVKKPVEAKPEIIPPKEIVSEVEPLKIEKKTEEVKPPEVEISAVAPKDGLPAEALAKAGPKIIHEEKKISPLIDSKKRSLSGLFGFLKKETKDKKHEIKPAPIKATIETPVEISKTPPLEIHKIAKTEIPKPRVVHYGGLQTSSPFGEPDAKLQINANAAKKEDVKPKIKPPENLPFVAKAENQHESAQNQPESMSEEEVIDLRTFEKLKRKT